MQAINKILIANQGEIARRIIRTAKSMEIATVAVFTGREFDSPFVNEADEACSLGEGDITSTYLNIELIISSALKFNCNAIHPGYGFLSENADFAQACKNAGIIFIGPEPEVIRLMGNKSESRNYVESLGISLLPSVKASFNELISQASKLKYPLMIKAVAGGGGKGMKIVHTEKDLEAAWESAQREALSYFGNGELYLEQYLGDARHIEVQVLGDRHGNVVHLFERECSIQRRHQKIIEEAPSVTLTEEIREKLLTTAVLIAQSMKYTSAGTLEFLFDKDLNFYFLEMNTRIQVEHPVSEAITGVDIIREQIRIAEGLPLSLQQHELNVNGHAIECRVYAEDPFSGFLPSAGEMVLNYLPDDRNIRIESAFEGATTVSSGFDPMIAKIIAHGTERSDAILKLRKYLLGCTIHGIKTNIEYLSLILNDDDYVKNNISTDYCLQKADELSFRHEKLKECEKIENLLAAVLAKEFLIRPLDGSIWQCLGAWRFPGTRLYNIESKIFEVDYQLLGNEQVGFSLNGQYYKIENPQYQEPFLTILLNGEKHCFVVSKVRDENYFISLRGLTFLIQRSDIPELSRFYPSGRERIHLSDNHVLSPLNGKIIKLNVKKGDKVNKGELLMIIESMKMENNILSPAEAFVTDVMVSTGDQVSGKDLLVKLAIVK